MAAKDLTRRILGIPAKDSLAELTSEIDALKGRIDSFLDHITARDAAYADILVANSYRGGVR